jgi:hypothetical protein
MRSAITASSSAIDRPHTATAAEKNAVVQKESRYEASLNRRSKFSSPTNTVDVPNASCCCTLRYTVWAAGQKKNASTMAIWGAMSTQGSHQLLKRTRFSTAKGSGLVGFLEPLEEARCRA